MIKKLISLIAFLMASTATLAALEVNKASEADLDSLKGIGPATTKLIIDERKKREFKDWNDLMSRVKGVGESRAAKLSAEGLTVGGVSFGTKNADTKAVNVKGESTSSTAIKPTIPVKESKN